MLDFSNVGPALRQLRAARDLKQAEVAEAAGITPPMLSAYETGKQRPSFATLDKVLEAMSYSADDLARAMLLLAPEGEAKEEAMSRGAVASHSLGEPLTEEEERLLDLLLPALLGFLRHTRD